MALGFCINVCDRFGYGATSVECAKMVHVWIQTKRVHNFLGLNKSRRRCGKKKTRARTHGDEEGYDHDPSICSGFFYEHGDISNSVSKSTRFGHRLTVALLEASARSHPQQWPNST
ncbi:hypothetical protein NC651_037737 [Populus alba x Populus x berolinensis]|nr:hypothetical protein NC651_037737 [Populus alba x Populus x berolinensis]